MALPSYIFLSTLSLRRATVDFSSNARATLISIHALLAESDMPISTSFPIALNFYPRSPCGERRNNSNNELVCTVFLSTLSLRRATCNNCIFCFCHKISIHALLAESDFEAGRAGMQAALFLSTLSLRRATSTSAKRWRPTEFLSTLSLRRATGETQQNGRKNHISIHALLAESDGKSNKLAEQKLVFLSTLSLRRATCVIQLIE